MSTFEDYLNEGSKIQIKRRYTEAHPATTVGKSARVRNSVLKAMKDGVVTEEEFNKILSELSSDPKRWRSTNSRYFFVGEDGIKLSKWGLRILAELDEEPKAAEVFEAKPVTENYEVIYSDGVSQMKKFRREEQAIDFMKKEIASNKKLKNIAVYKPGMHSTTQTELVVKFWGDGSYLDNVSKRDKDLAAKKLEENTNENMKQQFLYEKFSDFVEANFVNEKLGSMFFRDLLSKIGKYGNTKKVVSDVAKSFYNATNIALDKLEDSDFIISNNPTDAYKNTRGRDEMLFWISDNEKDNPYADSDGWNSKIPGGGVLLCITSGDRQVYTNSWDRWAPKKGYRLTKTSFKGDDPVGRLDNTKYRGWGATGINNGKRLAEISDRVAIINISLLKQKYSTNQIRTEREAAKKGAIAFKSDKEFKAENLARYHEIIANKAAKLPLDSMVEDAINVLSSQIQDAIKAGKKDNYNNIMIGTNSKGRACTLRDATNHMSNILDDYSRYVGYIADAEESEKRYGQKESYYERESKNYAKKIKEKIAKIEKLDYAW